MDRGLYGLTKQECFKLGYEYGKFVVINIMVCIVIALSIIVAIYKSM